METRRCPSCDKLIGTDYNFCIHCGFQLDEVLSSKKSIRCPSCGADNNPENIGCEKCGCILRKDGFHPSSAEYKRCLRCGNISPLNDFYCSICGYDFSSLWISKSYGDFFKNHPECTQYSKNIDFFKKINEFHDYDRFIYEFRRLCDDKNIEIFFDVGMVRCPECSDFFSFISSDFLKDYDCPHCGFKFDLDSSEGYCLNCGSPVEENQSRCECGYEFSLVKCPHCGSKNEYTNNHCTSCGKSLWDSDFTLSGEKPVGCTYENGRVIFDWEFLKKQIAKVPYKTKGEMNSRVLKSELSGFARMNDEISARWWIVSPFACKSCRQIIEPLNGICENCGVTHYDKKYLDRIKELKTAPNNYVKNRPDGNALNKAKWSFKPIREYIDDYIDFLAPEIGESQLEYRRRLFRQWKENLLIMHIIKSEWSIYFEDTCMNCGASLEKYSLYCPSCGSKREVSALAALIRDDDIKSSMLVHYIDFVNDVKDICRNSGADIQYVAERVVECPQCGNYFKFLTQNFIDTHKCPHCGKHFNITAKKDIPPKEKTRPNRTARSEPTSRAYRNDSPKRRPNRSAGSGKYNDTEGKRCPRCGAKLELRYSYINYGDIEGEEAIYECPNCKYSSVDHENWW